jgi:hypothetical protein
VHAFKKPSTAAKVRGSFAMVVALGLGGWIGLGGFLGWFCLWEGIDALWEPLIAAALLIVTLIEYPGGIAQQFAPVFNWLSFKRFGSGETVSAGVGGGSSARP